MLDFFYEKSDFYQLKELERMLPKEKGIVSQTVKEVLQSLVDDHMVCAEKIGTSNYFWSFPSNAVQSVKRTCTCVMMAFHRDKIRWTTWPKNWKDWNKWKRILSRRLKKSRRRDPRA